ncbi:MAG: glucose-6-phosphate isomerase [Francisellaceae bacterium]
MNKAAVDTIRYLVTQKYAGLSMKAMFEHDVDRFERYSGKSCGLLIDYSKNRINDEILAALFHLARQSGVERQRDAMFAGEKINITEDRAVLHTALRDFSNEQIWLDRHDIHVDVVAERARVETLVKAVHSGKWRGFSGKKITDIINIGIGGSDLGPKMVIHALSHYCLKEITVHFASNVDGESILQALHGLDPETTLIIVASKSFSTQETLMNAMTARDWLVSHFKDEAAVASHFIAVSSQLDKVQAFGIDLDNCFAMWDWVGGRYSLYSSIGIAIALGIGWDNFMRLLKGAGEMDRHFKNSPLEHNLPVILALISLLYSNFHDSESQVMLSYDERLSLLPDYLQQADMESNGKSCDRQGNAVDYKTGVILWGGVGTNGQHAFHQLLHQGMVLVPADFIIAKKADHDLAGHHLALIANCLAQSQALMQGKTYDEALAELCDAGMDKIKAEALAHHKVIAGNKPSNTIVLDRLTPESLGSLIALYEHKIFVQGVIWNINSFDQWGVELGKALGTPILDTLKSGHIKTGQYDASTTGLIQTFLS